MSKVRHAIVLSSVSHYGVQVIGLVSTIIVARLLTPDELGTYAIGSAFVMILGQIKLMGAGDYLVREAELSEDKIRGALGLTMLISWGLGLLVLFAAPVVASYYAMPPLAAILWILSPTFFIAPFLSISFSLMQRELNFKIMFKANLLSALLAFSVTIGLLLLGFSYYALAFGQLVAVLVLFFVVCFNSRAAVYWRPKLAGARIIAKFGAHNSIANLFKRSALLVPDLVIGKMGTTTQVGIFSRGLGFVNFLAMTLVGGISSVVLPFLSDAKRSGDDLRIAYTRATVLFGALIWPVLSVASVASLPVIRFLFGDQWDEAAPIASALALWYILSSTHFFCDNLLIASGHERVLPIKEGSLLVLLFILLISAFPFGLQTMAYAFLLLGFADLAINTWILAKKLGLEVGKFYRALLPNLVVSLVCAMTTKYISLYVPFNNPQSWKPIAAIAFCLPCVWLFTLWVLRHPLFFEVWRLLQSSTKKPS